jgi:CrcB protein
VIAWRLLPLVVAGGVVGVALRQAMMMTFEGGLSFGALVGTILVNVLGSGVLGFVAGRLGDRSPARRAFLGTGLLGGFTTYSGFAVLIAEFTSYGLVVLMVLFAGVALLAAGAAAILGLQAGTALARRARGEEPA